MTNQILRAMKTLAQADGRVLVLFSSSVVVSSFIVVHATYISNYCKTNVYNSN